MHRAGGEGATQSADALLRVVLWRTAADAGNKNTLGTKYSVLGQSKVEMFQSWSAR